MVSPPKSRGVGIGIPDSTPILLIVNDGERYNSAS